MPAIIKKSEYNIQYSHIDNSANIAAKKSTALREGIKAVVSYPKAVLSHFSANNSVDRHHNKDIELQKVKDEGEALHQLALADEHSAYRTALNQGSLISPQPHDLLSRIKKFSLLKKSALILATCAISGVTFTIGYKKGAGKGANTDVSPEAQHPNEDAVSPTHSEPMTQYTTLENLSKQASELAYTSQKPKNSKGRGISSSQILTQEDIGRIMGGDSHNDRLQINTFDQVSSEIVAAKNKVDSLCQSTTMVNNQPSVTGLAKSKWQFISHTLETVSNEVEHQREEIILRIASDAANYFSDCALRAKAQLTPSEWNKALQIPSNHGPIAALLRDLNKSDLTWLKDITDIKNLNSQLESIIDRVSNQDLLSLTTNEISYFADVFETIAKNHKNVYQSEDDVAKELIHADKNLAALRQASDNLNEGYKPIKEGMIASSIFNLDDWKFVMETLVDVQDREARIIERKADYIANHLSTYLKNKGEAVLNRPDNERVHIVGEEYVKTLSILAELDSANGDIQRLVNIGIEHSEMPETSMSFNANEMIELGLALKNKNPACVTNEYVTPCQQNS